MTELEKEKYPTTRIILSYACGGGAVGGFFMGLITLIVALFQQKSLDLSRLISIPILTMSMSIFFGIFLGLIPALITAIILVKKKFYIKSQQDYLYVAFLGFMISMIFFIFDIGMGLIGAVSAVIVGKWVLPKEE